MTARTDKTPTYPQVAINTSDSLITIRTNIRKQHNNKWYLWLVVYRAHVPYDLTLRELCELKASAINRLHREVYMVLMLGVVDESLVDQTGRLIIGLDPNQESEVDRLMKLI